MASCFSCGIDYEDPGFVEAVVSDEVWKIIAPNDGLLCIRCIAQRCADHGLSFVPVDLAGLILCSGVTIGTQPIQVVALGDEDIDAEYPNEDGHVGFYAITADGTPFHVLGDPNMSDETLDALRKLADAARDYVESKHIKPDDDWSPAPPEGYIALSDAEIEAAEEEDRQFRRCGECGQLHEDCQCFAGSEE